MWAEDSVGRSRHNLTLIVFEVFQRTKHKDTQAGREIVLYLYQEYFCRWRWVCYRIKSEHESLEVTSAGEEFVELTF